tara:strand:- start:1834 stop:2313 length:480 start_codon:yes stop_codon:yes gene_type:complete
MHPIDVAWQLLKMPIVDTAAGVPVAYGDDVMWDVPKEERDKMIGTVPFAGNRKDEAVDMTPNEYFDRLNENQELNLGTADSQYRWRGRKDTVKDRNEHVARMVEGLQSGQTMAAPSLNFTESSEEAPWPGHQEGGHRMEALRQMGHGDTPIPVFHHFVR